MKEVKTVQTLTTDNGPKKTQIHVHVLRGDPSHLDAKMVRRCDPR